MHTVRYAALGAALACTIPTSAHAQEAPPPAQNYSHQWTQDDDSLDGLFIAGFVGAGLSAASFVVFGIAASRIQQIEDDVPYRRYREGFVESDNVCERAEQGVASSVMGSAPPLKVRDMCSEANTWEVVSFVTLPLGVASLGAALLLISNSQTVEAATNDGPSLSVAVSPTGAALVGSF